MDYSYLDSEKYKDIPIERIASNKNNLPVFIARVNEGNQERHRHEYVQIVYTSKGRFKHVFNNNVFDVVSGDIFIIPPFVPHYFIDQQDEKSELVELEFTPEFINEKFATDESDTGFMDFAYLEPFLVTENEVRPRLNLTGNVRIEVESILSEIFLEYEIKKSHYVPMIKALVLKLLIMIGREFGREIEGTESKGLFDRHRDAVYAAIRYVNENYDKEVSIETAAHIAMLSQSYFRYLFKQITQKTMVEYVNSLRIAKATELLKTNYDMRVIDICYNVGYNNINNFNRTFRQETGMTPIEYRKSTRST